MGAFSLIVVINLLNRCVDCFVIADCVAMAYRNARKTFLDYFAKHGHTHVPSSPVVPSFHDRSCLFVNAGMFQFKNIFLGQQHPDFPDLKKAVNSQKCVRISGKHNDLDVVGKDGNHHTFFEMLGNWSFGAYSSEAACHMALDLLVNYYKLPLSKLYITYFGGGEGLDPDLKLKDVWLSLGVPENQIVRGHINKSSLGKIKSDNFWTMGSSGPCGTCTEIYYDIDGFMADRDYFYNRHTDYLEEIWNIVMIKYDRQAHNGQLVSLPVNHIDTGMGFERLVKILEGKRSNYETSLFQSMTEYLEGVNGRGVKFSEAEGVDRQAFQTLLDHLRCLTVAVNDGATFTQGDRGPPLKQILKRALWFGERILQIENLDWEKIVSITGEVYSDVFPEILQNQERTIEIIQNESLKAKKNLFQTEESLLKKLKLNSFSLENVRRLYEQGIPLEVARLICKDNGIVFSTHDIMKLISYTPTHNPQFSTPAPDFPDLTSLYPRLKETLELNGAFPKPEVKGGGLTLDNVNILSVVQDGAITSSNEVKEGKASLVLNETAFYPAVKGHASDTGWLTCGETVFRIERVEAVSDLLVHHGTFQKIGEDVKLDLRSSSYNLSVDSDRRLAIARAHTALAVAVYNTAREFAMKNKDLNIVETAVGLDRATFTVSFYADGYGRSMWAEICRTCEQFVTLSYAHKKTYERGSNEVSQEDIVSYNDSPVMSPFHRIVSYPCGQFRPTNLSLASQDMDKVSANLNVLSCGPHLPEVQSLDAMEIIDAKRNKSSYTKVYITSGPIAADIQASMKEVSDQLPSVYEMSSKTKKLKALKELTHAKTLSYRFRNPLNQKKLHVPSSAGTKFFGLFDQQNFR